MRKFSRVATVAVTTLVASVLVTPAYACTGVIIGKDLTTDGSTIFGRTEDLEQNHPKRLLVHSAGQYKAGETIPKAPATSWAGAKWTQEKDSLKFTSISDVTPEEGDFDEAGFNAAGVAVDATVSAGASDETLAVDPYVEEADANNDGRGGWEEGSLATVLLANATSAQEGIKLMARMVDRDGMAEGDILVIGDNKELWYMELYSGHQYAAMKYPADKYSVFPNAYWMEKVDCADTANFICSENLEKIAKKAGTAKYNSDGSFNPAASYNPKAAQQSSGNASRVWSGLKTLDPGNPATLAQKSDYTFLNSPSSKFKKLSIADAIKMQRNRFQGIDNKLAKLSEKVAIDHGFLNVKGKKVEGARYPVGNTNVLEAHIFQLPTGMPKTIPGTLWQAIGTPQGSPYLPYYGNITSTIKEMQSMSHTERLPRGNNPRLPAKEDDNSYYWVATQVSKYVEDNRARWAGPVMDYLHSIESPLIAKRQADNAKLIELYKQNPEVAAKWATDEFSQLSTNSYKALKNLRDYIKQTNTNEAKAKEKGIEIGDGSYLADSSNEMGYLISDKPLPINTSLSIKSIGINSVKAKNILLNPKYIWDIKLLQDKKEIQPDSKVTIRLNLPKGAEKSAISKLMLYHFVNGWNSSPEEVPFKVEGKQLVFSVNSLSPFVLATGLLPGQISGVIPGNNSSGVIPSNNPMPKAESYVKDANGLAATGSNAALWLLVSFLFVTAGIGIYSLRRRNQ